jgi:hypothetical protein
MSINDMAQLPSKLNVIPIRDVAILPGTKVSFKVGREKSLRALVNSLNSHNQIALFTQIDANNEFPEIHDLHPIGVLCEIIVHTKLSPKQIKVIVESRERIRVFKLIKSSPYLVIKPIEAVETESKANIKLPPKKHIKEAVSLLLKYKPELPLNSSDSPIPYDAEAGILADFLVTRSGTNFENKLACLLELNPHKRLKLAYEILVKEGQQAQLENEINEEVTKAIKDEHREIYLRGQLKIILEQLGEGAPLSLYNPIFRGKSFKANPKLSFVLMPFAEEFRPIYNEIIKPVVERFGLTCIRADDLYGSKAIIEDIWRLVNEAKIIIADVTGKNPNVFYEIGLAHAVGKEVIIISQTIEDVPFDLRHLRCFIYQDTVAGFRRLESQLQQALTTIEGLIKPELQS